MAIKIKKRVDEPETPETDGADEQDENPVMAAVPEIGSETIFQAPRDTFGWITDNRGIVIGGLAAIVLAIIGGSFWMASREAGRVESTHELLRALDITGAPTAADDVTAGELQFATLEERLQAQSAEARRIAAAQRVRGVSRQATLLAAAADLGLGRTDEARDAYRDYRAGAVNVLERSVAELGVASALAQGGQLGEALELLGALESEVPAAAAAVQLHRALLIDSFGAPDAALAAWRSVVARQQEGLATGAFSPRATDRVRQLELLLGASSGGPEGTPEGEPGAE